MTVTETTTTLAVPDGVLEAEQAVLRSRDIPEELRQTIALKGYVLVTPWYFLGSDVVNAVVRSFNFFKKKAVWGHVPEKFLSQEETLRYSPNDQIDYSSLPQDEFTYILGQLRSVGHIISGSGSLWVLIPSPGTNHVACVEMLQNDPTFKRYPYYMNNAPLENTLGVILKAHNLYRDTTGKLHYQIQKSNGVLKSKVVQVGISGYSENQLLACTKSRAVYYKDTPLSNSPSSSLMEVYSRLVEKSHLVTLKSVGLNESLEYVGPEEFLLDPVFKGLVSYIQSYPETTRSRNDAEVGRTIREILIKEGNSGAISNADCLAENHLQKLQLEARLDSLSSSIGEDALLAAMSRLQRLIATNNDVVRELPTCSDSDFLRILVKA